MLKKGSLVDNFKIFVTHIVLAPSIGCNDWRYYLTIKLNTMKNYLLSFCLLLIGGSLFSQNIVEDRFQDLYEAENATTVNVTGKMFGYAKHFTDTGNEDVDEMANFASSINEFVLVMMKEMDNPQEAYKNGLGYLENDNFEELVKIRSEDGNFSLYIDESNDIVHEIVGIGTPDEGFVVFSLTGNMDLEQIGKMASQIQMDGFNKMETIDTYDVTAVKVYPNPIRGNGSFNLELPEELDGASVTLVNDSGALVKTYSASAGKQSLNADNLTPGMYFVNVEKEGVSVRKKLIVIE